MAKHYRDLVLCGKQPGIAIGRLCEKCMFEYSGFAGLRCQVIFRVICYGSLRFSLSLYVFVFGGVMFHLILCPFFSCLFAWIPTPLSVWCGRKNHQNEKNENT